MSAKCKGHAIQSFIWDVFMATKSIYSISVVLSYNHITNVKGHTCCTAIYLEATIIAPNYSPQEFVLMFVHLMCMRVSLFSGASWCTSSRFESVFLSLLSKEEMKLQCWVKVIFIS